MGVAGGEVRVCGCGCGCVLDKSPEGGMRLDSGTGRGRVPAAPLLCLLLAVAALLCDGINRRNVCNPSYSSYSWGHVTVTYSQVARISQGHRRYQQHAKSRSTAHSPS